MIKRCDCGFVKTVQPYKDAREIRFKCEHCLIKSRHEYVQKSEVASDLMDRGGTTRVNKLMR